LFFDGETPIAGVLSRPSARNKIEGALWIGSVATKNVEKILAKQVIIKRLFYSRLMNSHFMGKELL
jgi:hypothetical protein